MDVISGALNDQHKPGPEAAEQPAPQLTEQLAGRVHDDADRAVAAQAAAEKAQAVVQTQAASLNYEPSWIYALVLCILGAALIALVIAMVISALTGKGAISTDIVSMATLIIGGLIGVLAPTPGTKKPTQQN